MPHATIDNMKTAETIIHKQVCDLSVLIKWYEDGFKVVFKFRTELQSKIHLIK